MTDEFGKFFILDDHNNVVKTDLMGWARWMERGDNRRVGWTQITSEPECHVSTVFLGVDHRYYGKGPPIVFETMIFGGPRSTQPNA